MIRKANFNDLDKIEALFDEVTENEAKKGNCGWKKGVYPTRTTAEDALKRDDLFIGVIDDEVVSCCALNQLQAEEYKNISWKTKAEEREILVVHTLCVSPRFLGKGLAKELLSFAESYGKNLSCKVIRLDTFEGNSPAFSLYKNCGFELMGKTAMQEIGKNFLCLEKPLS